MSDIFSAIRPIYIVSKCLGLGPFRIDREQKQIKESTPGIVYSVFVLVIFTINAGFFIYTKVVSKDKRIESYISLATDVILLACGFTVTTCSILLIIVQRNKFVRIVENFHAVGFEMAKLNEQIPYKNLLTYSILYLCLLFLVLAALLIHSIFYHQTVSYVLYFSHMCSWFVPKIYNFLMEYQFVSAALLLKIHFKTLNRSLEKFGEKGKAMKDPTKMLDVTINNNAWINPLDNQINSKIMTQNFTVWDRHGPKFRTRKIWASENSGNLFPGSLDKIKIIRKIHSNLCEIKEYLNSSFSLQLLTSVAQAFIYITANLYIIFTTLSGPSKPSAMALSYPILWSLAHTIELVIIVVTCTDTSKTANYTAILVHKLLAKDCPSDLRNQLKLFSIQLLHRKISFTASGFFTLDMTLLQAIIGAATTYLVILIQFHNTYEVPKSS